MDYHGDGGASVSNKVDVYLCLDCGHYEFFSMKKVEDYNKTLSIIKDMEQEIKDLQRKLEELQDPTVTKKITDEIERSYKKSKSLDITIRQQQELTSNIFELNRKVAEIPKEIAKIKKRISSIEVHIRTIKHNFEVGNF